MHIEYDNNNIMTSKTFYKKIKPYVAIYDGIKLTMTSRHHYDHLAEFRLKAMIMINEIDMYIDEKIEDIKDIVSQGYMHNLYPAIIIAYQMIYKDYSKEEVISEIDDCIERGTNIIITDILNGREALPEHIDNDNTEPIESDSESEED
jgi:hypothetical protein